MRTSLLLRLNQLTSLLRLHPFDHSTAEDRSKERHRRVVLTALVTAATQGLTILTALISVPLTVGYLGTERYGLWMTMNSVVAMLGFADLGMANGLLTAISEAHGKDDRQLVGRYVSSAFFMLGGIALILAGAFVIIYPWIPWKQAFNISSSQAIAEVGPAMCVLVACFLLGMPFGIVYRVQIGYQEGFTASLWAGFGSLLGLGGVLLAIYLRAGLPWLVLAMAGGPALAALLNNAVLFGIRRPWLRPHWIRVTGAAAGKVLHLGLLFFVLQIAIAFVYSSDNLIAAQVLGPQAVAEYAIFAKLFTVVPLVLGLVIRPLWPAYGESISRGDVPWVKTTLVRSLKLSLLVAALISTLLVAFGPQIVKLWVGPGIVPAFLLLLGLGVWTVLGAAGDAVAMFLNGLNIMRFQTMTALLMTVVAVILKIVLARSIGLPGIVWGTVIAYSICTALPTSILIKRLWTGTRLQAAPKGERLLAEESRL
jgi:O-antigen/teichoic acid export membrane protein